MTRMVVWDLPYKQCYAVMLAQGRVLQVAIQHN